MIKANTLASFIVVAVLIACKPRTFNSATPQSLNAADFQKQFETTQFSECFDSNGKKTGSLNFVWRTHRANGEAVVPYILGFSGQVFSRAGDRVEFRSVSTIDEPRYRTPQLGDGGSFPVPQYFAASLQYPADELAAGWGYLRVNGVDQKIEDVFGGTLVLPKYDGDKAFSTRHFLVTADSKTHEFNCAALTDAVRSRMKTYLVSDGSHGFTGERGVRVADAVDSRPVLDPTPAAGALDLRPVRRPASYDVQFRHERIYDCDGTGGIDVIWRQAESNGKALPPQSQYILGLAGALKDDEGRELRFSSVTIDSAPAFSAGREPSPKSYLRPMFEFDSTEVQQGLAFHGSVPGLQGRTLAVGGTLWIPYDGSGSSVSAAISLGSTLRSSAYQVIADCTPKNPHINRLLTSCVGRSSVDAAGTCQF